MMKMLLQIFLMVFTAIVTFFDILSTSFDRICDGLMGRNIKILLGKDHLIYRTSWRATRKIPYRSLRGVQRQGPTIIITTDEAEHKVGMGSKASLGIMAGVDELQKVCLQHIKHNAQHQEKGMPSWNL